MPTKRRSSVRTRPGYRTWAQRLDDGFGSTLPTALVTGVSMNDADHYSPDLFALLVQVIPA
jgi:hypothetical protein